MGEAVVVRWRRYGKDRLYVNGPGGERYGWGDLLTGTVDVSEERHRDLVERKLREHPVWQLRQPKTISAGDPPPRDVAATPPDTRSSTPAPGRATESPPLPERPWLDLAKNRPGAAARARAIELRKAAPIRTRLARLIGVHTDERAWRIGADGEESVARELAKLGDEWQTLHAVPIGHRGADIDHLLIGPGGVFTINTKKHPHARIWVGGDTVLIGRDRVPYVRNARYEAQRVQRLLSAAVGYEVSVTGIVAIMCPQLTIKSEPADVLVIDAGGLRPWFRHLGRTWAPDQVRVIFERARRSTTWQAAATR